MVNLAKTTEIKDRISIIEDDIKEINNKLSQCRREECKKDHDSLLLTSNKLENTNEKIKNLTEEINDLDSNLSSTITLINQMSGNINQLTDKIADVVKKENSRKDFLWNVIGNIIITLISAFIIFMSTRALSSIINYNNSENERIQRTIFQLEKNMEIIEKSIKNSKNE